MTDCIQAGVTTVVGMLGTDSEAKSVEALVAKTKGLNEQEITAYCLTGSYMSKYADWQRPHGHRLHRRGYRR